MVTPGADERHVIDRTCRCERCGIEQRIGRRETELVRDVEVVKHQRAGSVLTARVRTSR